MVTPGDAKNLRHGSWSAPRFAEVVPSVFAASGPVVASVSTRREHGDWSAPRYGQTSPNASTGRQIAVDVLEEMKDRPAAEALAEMETPLAGSPTVRPSKSTVRNGHPN